MRQRQVSIALQGNKMPAEYAALGELVETLGFDGVSVYADLGFQPAIGPLLILAQHTKRLRLGPAALNPSLIHPVEIAGQIAMLDMVSDGRAYLGLVRGAWLDAIGLNEARPLQRMREAIEVIERVLAGDGSGFEGSSYRLPPRRLRQYHVRRERIPLLLGTWGRQMAGLAGERAEEVKIGGSANSAMVPVMRGYLQSGEVRANRTAGSVGIVLGAVTVCDENSDAARTHARREVARYLPVVAPLDPSVRLDPGLLRRMANLVARQEYDTAGRLVSDEVLDRFAFAGTPQQIVRQSEAIFAAGASRIEFGTPHGLDSAVGIRLLGERVLPALRSG